MPSDSVPVATRGSAMRGKFQDPGGLFSYLSPESRVPRDHPAPSLDELAAGVAPRFTTLEKPGTLAGFAARLN